MIEDFYPTPESLIRKMLEGININHLSTVLDIGAGKADIADYIKNNQHYHRTISIDVIEINPELQLILKGKNYRLIHDDFLTFRTRKFYELLIANFPFSTGDRQLNNALDLVEQNGGMLRCLVNAETIRNPYTKLRRAVVERLDRLGAEIEYLENEFVSAERKTNVEVALVKVSVKPEAESSLILDSLQKAAQVEAAETEATGLVERNFISQIIANFNMECEIGINLIGEFFALKPLMKNRLVKPGESRYTSEIIELKIGNAHGNKTSFVNEYLEQVRHKYWALLIEDERFRSRYTSNIIKQLEQKLSDLKNYDFTLFNIRELEQDLSQKITAGIESSILDIFETFTSKFAWFDYGSTVHLFNGWKTNKALKIGKKAIIPMNGFSSYSSRKSRLDDYYLQEKLADLVKVFNFLAGEQINVKQLVGESIEEANENQKFSNINLRYITCTFYKKGTCHIQFLDQKLLDKLNIFGSQRKNWLPPSYGKKPYSDMDAEEKAVIDSFSGKDHYEEVMKDSKFYLVETKVLQLAGELAIAA